MRRRLGMPANPWLQCWRACRVLRLSWLSPCPRRAFWSLHARELPFPVRPLRVRPLRCTVRGPCRWSAGRSSLRPRRARPVQPQTRALRRWRSRCRAGARALPWCEAQRARGSRAASQRLRAWPASRFRLWAGKLSARWPAPSGAPLPCWTGVRRECPSWRDRACCA